MSANSWTHRDMEKRKPLTVEDIYNIWREDNKTRDLAPSIIQDYAKEYLLSPIEWFKLQVMRKIPSDLKNILRSLR